MLSKLKSMFGDKSAKPAPNKVTKQAQVSETAEAEEPVEYGSRSLEHARELGLAFISNLLGVRAVANEGSLQQELELRAELDGEMSGMTEKSIPKLSKNSLTLMSDLLDPETAQKKIIDAVKEDPALVGKIISITNSPVFVAPDIKIKDLEHAISMLGQARLRDLVMASLVSDQFKVNNYYFETFGKGLWDHSSEVANISRKIAEQTGGQPGLAFFVGLIHDVGKLVIFKKLVEIHARDKAEPHPQVFSHLLNDYSHALTRRACEIWQLPTDWYQPILEFQFAEPGDLKQPESVALFLANTYAELNALFLAGEITQFELVWRLQEAGTSLDEFCEVFPETVLQEESDA